MLPLAQSVATGGCWRGIAICGSDIGVSFAANQVVGIRACLIEDLFSARLRVERDNLNIMCLGGLVVGHAAAWEMVKIFLAARFNDSERHQRRLEEVSSLVIPVVGGAK